jgi:diphthamide biosynthesis protein 4
MTPSPSPTQDHYAILGIPTTATPDQIKAAYRSAVLHSHPDKSTTTTKSQLQFLSIQRAYETLIDPGQRKDHDATLASQSAKQDVHINEKVDISDMDLVIQGDDEQQQSCLSWSCRCGGCYVVSVEDVATQQGIIMHPLAPPLLIPCSTCSLYIQLTTHYT